MIGAVPALKPSLEGKESNLLPSSKRRSSLNAR
jgi:hypothetical protein